MDFKTFFEDNKKTHDYSCTMAMVVGDDLSLFQKFAKLIDDKDLGKDGIDPETHCTILYGTHTSDLKEIKEALKKTGITKINMKLKKLSTFPPNSSGEIVLKVDIESIELQKLNKALCKLPFTTDFPRYHPHITIAYLKKGKEKNYLDIDIFKDKKISTSSIMFSTAGGKKHNFKLNEL